METGFAAWNSPVRGGDVPENGVQPLTILTSLVVGEQLLLSGLTADVIPIIIMGQHHDVDISADRFLMSGTGC